MKSSSSSSIWRSAGILRSLLRDRAGNTLALVAAAILPLLGIVGGGVDMGRSYLAQARLQQACDAGVLAARKRLGTESAVTGTVPAEVATFGQRFFNLNFRNGIYGTEDRDFTMTLENDYAISGVATVDVPTTVMTIFGFEEVPIAVECEARLNFSELDVMMVLDVTGSMKDTNPGDSLSRMDSLKQVIRDFHTQLEASKAPGSNIRYGFVPYNSNVNVGSLLEDDWVVDQWTYQSRINAGTSQTVYNKTTYENFVVISGSRSDWIVKDTNPATLNPAVGEGGTESYSCTEPAPPNTVSYNYVTLSTTSEPYAGPPAGIKTIKHMKKTADGIEYRIIINGTTCELQERTHNNFVEEYDEITVPAYNNTQNWTYKPVSIDTTNWRTETAGCIEERKSTQIADYGNVDLSQNLDLDIDLTPTAGDPDSQWRPRYPGHIYVRSIYSSGSGTITPGEVTTPSTFATTGNWWFSNCPAPARKLQPMTSEELDTYLNTLAPAGSTYHDIGMIWGARLISPTGLFAAENAPSEAGAVKTRNLIFLTDGQTEAYDIAYGAYAIEGLDRRRWDDSSTMSLAQTVEARFKFACLEAKKRNVNVWIIAFGTNANQAMIDCAGNGRYFEAANAAQLNDAFSAIAKSMGDLRISR